jgi:hypothetical protein
MFHRKVFTDLFVKLIVESGASRKRLTIQTIIIPLVTDYFPKIPKLSDFSQFVISVEFFWIGLPLTTFLSSIGQQVGEDSTDILPKCFLIR